MIEKKPILLVVVVLLSCLLWQPSYGENNATPHDTLCIYQSWESILDGMPDQVLLDPYIEVVTPFDVYFETGDEMVDRMLHEATVAVALGDSLWFVSAVWMQDNFNGDCHKMDDWVPLFFNAKIAFVQWHGQTFFGLDDENGDPYLIDFAAERVDKVDAQKLTQLLDPYPDLQRRYVSMKDYKKRHVIEFYFREYIDRITADPLVPYIVD